MSEPARQIIAYLAIYGLVAGIGCAPKVPRQTDGGYRSLAIVPPEITLWVNSSSISTQFLAWADGIEVSDRVSWSVNDSALGSINRWGGFTSQYPLSKGGPATIKGVLGDLTQTAVARVVDAPSFLAAGSPPSVQFAFDGPPSGDPQDAPRIVEPQDGITMSPGAHAPVLGWEANARSAFFSICIAGDYTNVTFYMDNRSCRPLGMNTQKCTYEPGSKVWDAIARSAPGAAVAITVTASAGPGADVGVSEPIRLLFCANNCTDGGP